MLQIIGWLGCLYLLVKGVEFLSSNAHRTDGKLHIEAIVGAVLAIGGAVIFVVLFNMQASGSPSAFSGSPSFVSPPYDPSAIMNIDENLTTDMNAVDMNATIDPNVNHE